MPSICFYFQVHQPFRLLPYSFQQIGTHEPYENEEQNRTLLRRISEQCYLPTNEILYKLIQESDGKFCCTFSISGVALEQFEKYYPEVIQSFQKLVDTGYVEILSETYYHSLSYVYDQLDFVRQVKKHREKIKQLFGITPSIFRNTELIYDNDLTELLTSMKYKAVLAEGVDSLLKGNSPNFLYQSPLENDMVLLLKNYRFSDDIAFRFTDQQWEHYPLTVQKYVSWLKELEGKADLINLFMDYETFGEHHNEKTGILAFLEKFPSLLFSETNFDFVTPSKAIERYQVKGNYNAPKLTSWADEKRDLSAWNENNMQQDAIKKVYSFAKKLRIKKFNYLLPIWRKLQTSDHFYYMSTKYMQDGQVHKYFSPFDTPYDAYIYYMNVLSDFEKYFEVQAGQKSKPLSSGKNG